MHHSSLERVASDRGSPPAPRVEAVLVDMDDTIFDHSLTCRAAIASLRRELSWLRALPLDALWREYLQRLGDDFGSVGSYVGKPGLSVAEARSRRWQRIAEGHGVGLSPAEATELSSRYRERYQRLRRAVPGARELLRAVHADVATAVVTNNEVAEQEEKVRFLGIGDCVDALVTSQAVGAAKPDRQIFDAALRAVGVGADRATMLGDSWESDVVGARSAGIRPVWFNRFGVPPAGPDACETLRSLRPRGPARALLLGESRASGPAGRPTTPRAL